MLTKHKIFKISIKEVSDDYVIESETTDKINEFLADPNCIYVSHSVTVLGKDTSPSGNRYRDVLLLISIVYKDLSDSPLQLQNVSTKTKEIVRKSFETGQDLPDPAIKTTFDLSTERYAEEKIRFLVGKWYNKWGDTPDSSETATINSNGEYFVDGEHWLTLNNIVIDLNKKTISFEKIGVKPGDDRILLNVLNIVNENLLTGTESLNNDRYDISYRRIIDVPLPD